MFENLCAVFAAPPDGPEGDRGEWLAAVIDAAVGIPGVRAARHFETRSVLGTEEPAGFTRLVLLEVDGALGTSRSLLGRHFAQICSTPTRERRGSGYFCGGLGGHGEIELP